MKYTITIILILLLSLPTTARRVMTGDEFTSEYFPLVKGKKIAVYSNHTGLADTTHVVDLLLQGGMNVAMIFSPEHGFRGNADAGEHVKNSTDEKNGIPIYSLYNDNDETATDAFDVLIVDIQDVGLRFYTYYVTMWKLMNLCAKTQKPIIVLDRPNPNGFYVDGPILDMKYRSGVGWLPIPIVHGMTLGELALMINGEKWLDNGLKCDLRVIPCRNYRHSTRAKLTVPPSPNLPNMKSIYLYPSTCYFEGTTVSLGRGTDKPFQVYGHPDMKNCSYTFTPQSTSGAKNPPLVGKLCRGKNLSEIPDREICKKGINLSYVIDAYKNMGAPRDFFTKFFDLLTGRSYIREMIEQGRSADEIKATWKKDVEKFKKQRKPYLLYK